MISYKISYKVLIAFSTILLGLSYKFPFLKYLSILLYLFSFFLKNKLVISKKDLLQIPQINVIFLILFSIPGSIIVRSFDYYIPSNISFMIQGGLIVIVLNQFSRFENKDKVDILKNLFLGLFILLIFIIVKGDLLAVKDSINMFHGGFGNRFNFSLFTSFSSILSLALFLSKNIGNKFKILLLINLLFTLPLNFLTFSRTGIYSLVGSLFLALVIEIFFRTNLIIKNKSISKKSINKFAKSFLILTIVSILLRKFYYRLLDLFDLFSKFNEYKGFLSGREIYIEKITSLINTHPQISIFGVGGPDYLAYIEATGFKPLDTGGYEILIFQHGIFFLLICIFTCTLITLKLINPFISFSQRLLLAFTLITLIAPSSNFFSSLHVTHTIVILLLQSIFLHFNTLKNLEGANRECQIL